MQMLTLFVRGGGGGLWETLSCFSVGELTAAATFRVHIGHVDGVKSLNGDQGHTQTSVFQPVGVGAEMTVVILAVRSERLTGSRRRLHERLRVSVHVPVCFMGKLSTDHSGK